MASPVDTSVKNFNNTMVNAPVFNGVAGSLVGVLDACLVTGFDPKSLVSLVALAGVMTATFSGTHSSQVDSVVLVAGVTGGPTGFAGANGEQKVAAAPSPTVRTWATALPDGTYTGTITMKMAAAGWEKVYTGTNKAVYRSLDPASTKMLLRVDDTGTTSARVVGYESMSDVDTGISPFPTTAQISGGGYWPKATTANATVVPWALHADGRAFFFSNQPAVAGNANTNGGQTRYFGDFIAFRPGGDGFACGLNYSVTIAVQSQHEGSMFAQVNPGGSTVVYQTAAPRSYTGLGSSWLMAPVPYVGATNGVSGIDASFGSFPSDVDGSLQLGEKYFTGGSVPRGRVPGAYHVPQNFLFNNFKHLETVAGTGLLAGRTMQAVTTMNPTTNLTTAPTTTTGGVAFIDITGPWR